MNKQLIGGGLGFCSGVIIAVVCLVMMPVAFLREWAYLGAIGILTGVCIMAAVEPFIDNKGIFAKTAVMLLLMGAGMWLSSVPSRATGFLTAVIGGAIVYGACGYVVLENESPQVTVISCLAAVAGLLAGAAISGIL